MKLLEDKYPNLYHTFIPDSARYISPVSYTHLDVYKRQDLDGAASRHVVNYRVLDQISSRTSLVIDFGGGIKTDEDLGIAFDNGAQMVTLGSVAVKKPRLFKKWLEQYGNEKIILGADVKRCV